MHAEQGRAETAEHADTRSVTTLGGHGLLLARAAWLGLAALVLTLFLAGLPWRITELGTECTAPPCREQQLDPDGARSIRESGLSLGSYAT